MKNEMRSEITDLFWLSYVVFLSSAWKNVGMTIKLSHTIQCMKEQHLMIESDRSPLTVKWLLHHLDFFVLISMLIKKIFA